MPRPLFRVKRYAHAKYKFLVRAKVAGKWQRRYFATENEAIAFARDQNDRADRYLNSPAPSVDELRTPELPTVSPNGFPANADYSQLVVPAYTGPRIERYFGDHWSMHLPFAYELMRELKPRIFVELGVWKGESYFTFCQSAAEHRTQTRCYGIDTWRGDVHMGEHDPQIAIDVAEYNRRYSSFSELKPMTFKEALPDFAEGLIDLLHIDGAHTYEDVKSDFESWLPKLSPHGVILFHDVLVRDYGCRVWKLWDEIARPGKSFVFEFGYGLGVWKQRELTAEDPEILRRLLGATSEEKKRINEHYATAAAALALWRSTGNRQVETTAAHPLHIQLFVDQGHGFSEAASLSSNLAPHGRQTVRFEHIERLRPEPGRPLRIDPVDQPAFVNISSIKVIRDFDEALLYSAESAADFQQIKVSDGLLKLEEEGMLSLIVVDADPQLFLPALDFPVMEDCRLEIVLEPCPAPISILALQKRALESAAREKISAQAEQVRLPHRVNVKDAQIKTLQRTVAEMHARWTDMTSQLQHASVQSGRLRRQANRDSGHRAAIKTQLRHLRTHGRGELARLAANLQDARQQNRELQAQTELDAEQIQALEKTRVESARIATERIRRIEEQARGQADRLSAVVDLQRANEAGLQIYSAHLEQRLHNVSQQLHVTGQALKKSDFTMPATVDLISEDIRRIHHPSFPWRMVKALGFLRLAPAGVPRTAAERRALAKELKAALREICRALSSPTTTPEETAGEIHRLFLLHRRTRELLHSLKLSRLFRPSSHIWNIVHWSRRVPGDLSVAPAVSALFDPAWYLGQNPDVAVSGVDPLKHYLKWGAREGRDPNPAFDSAWYLEQNPEVASAGLDPLKHYWDSGVSEDRDPNPFFSTTWYLAQNQDVAASGINPLAHYLAHGAEEGRDPHPLFSAAWYVSQNPETGGMSLLKHYLQWGRFHGRSPHPLFDAEWYLNMNHDVAAKGTDPLQHYLEHGAAEGRDPHPLFDSKWYLAQGASPGDTGQSPLEHYLFTGAKERRSPHPLFDAHWYADFPGLSGCDDLLTHYLTVGWRRGYKPSPDFDSQAYLKAHPDVGESGLEPLTHFVLYGREDGEDYRAEEASFESYDLDFEDAWESFAVSPATRA